MNMNKMYLIAQCIVNRTMGKDVKLSVEPMYENSSVNFNSDPYTNKNSANYFRFGCFGESQKDENWYKIVCNRFPIAKTVEPALFAMLHEIGHVYAPANLTNRILRALATTSEEYRNLPDEAFADKWASDYITKNKMIVKIWNKQLIEALQ